MPWLLGSFGFSNDDDDFFDYENRTLTNFVILDVIAFSKLTWTCAHCIYIYIYIDAVDSVSNDFDIVLKNAARAALRKGLVNDPNDLLVITAGIPL